MGRARSQELPVIADNHLRELPVMAGIESDNDLKGKGCNDLQLQRLATAIDRHYEASQVLELGTTADYYDLRWHLRRLDQLVLLATKMGKYPAAVAAQRTMMEAAGLIGPQISIDARTEVLQLPEGMSEAALIALATGSYAAPEIGVLE